MGLIRKALFFGTAATGMPLVRFRSSAEAAAREQHRLMQEQNSILSRMANQHSVLDDELDDDYEPSVPVIVQNVEQEGEPSLTEKLTEIKALLDKGVITADEHMAMRKKILGV